ncbi:hypothetical protein ACA910_019081 [Epithemia clementina (nom. ined.)]
MTVQERLANHTNGTLVSWCGLVLWIATAFSSTRPGCFCWALDSTSFSSKATTVQQQQDEEEEEWMSRPFLDADTALVLQMMHAKRNSKNNSNRSLENFWTQAMAQRKQKSLAVMAATSAIGNLKKSKNCDDEKKEQEPTNLNKQLVYLQFDPLVPYYPVDVFEGETFEYCYTVQIPRRVITKEQREAIAQRIQHDYSAFGPGAFEFTMEEPSTNPFDRPFTTLAFFYEPTFLDFDFFQEYGAFFQVLVESCQAEADGEPEKDSQESSNIVDDENNYDKDAGFQIQDVFARFLGGVAENVDFLNTNFQEMAVLDATDFIDFMLIIDPTGTLLEQYFDVPRQPDQTIDDYINELIVNGASNIGAHELGHLCGLRHYDSLTPIGAGLGDENSTTYTNFLWSIMNSPAFTWQAGFGEELAEQALTNVMSANHAFSERAALKLQLSILFQQQQQGHGHKPILLSEEDLTTFNRQQGPKKLVPVRVTNVSAYPNTSMADQDGVERINFHHLNAVTVHGSIESSGEVDYYDFELEAEQFLNIEVISMVDNKFYNIIDPFVQVYMVDNKNTNNDTQQGSVVLIASNDDDGLESFDSWILDFRLPARGTYRIAVSAYPFSPFFLATGDYVLFMYTGTQKHCDDMKNKKVGKKRKHLDRTKLKVGEDKTDSEKGSNGKKKKKRTKQSTTGPVERRILNADNKEYLYQDQGNEAIENTRGNSARRRREIIRTTIDQITRGIVPPSADNAYTGNIVAM